MTVQASCFVQQQSKTLEVIAGQSEPAVITFKPSHPVESAEVRIEMQGDLGHQNEFIDLYINGRKTGSLTTGNHTQVYQQVLKKDISSLIQPGQPIVLQFQPTRYVDKLWPYAWKAMITLSLGYARQTHDGTLVEFLAPTVASANVMMTSSQSLSASGQNLATGQQQTAAMQYSSNLAGVQSILEIESAVISAVADKKHMA